MGCSPWGRWESDTTERLHFHFSLSCFVEGNGNPLQCSCLENPRDHGAWWAAVYGVAQNQTRLKRLSPDPARLLPETSGLSVAGAQSDCCYGYREPRPPEERQGQADSAVLLSLSHIFLEWSRVWWRKITFKERWPPPSCLGSIVSDGERTEGLAVLENGPCSIRTC